MAEENLIVKGLKEAYSALANVAKQSKYASMKAINNTAAIIQDAEIAEAGKDFTIRKNWLRKNTKFGVNRTYATKDKLESVIGSQAMWLKDQEFGGTKTQDVGKYSPVLIPAKDIRQDKSRLVPKKLALSTIKADPKKAHAWQMPDGDWFYRKSKTQIAPLFIREDSVKLKPRYPFTAVGEKIAQDVFEDEFSKAFEIAMETST